VFEKTEGSVSHSSGSHNALRPRSSVPEIQTSSSPVGTRGHVLLLFTLCLTAAIAPADDALTLVPTDARVKPQGALQKVPLSNSPKKAFSTTRLCRGIRERKSLIVSTESVNFLPVPDCTRLLGDASGQRSAGQASATGSQQTWRLHCKNVLGHTAVAITNIRW
jgi:hypothetical protein